MGVGSSAFRNTRSSIMVCSWPPKPCIDKVRFLKDVQILIFDILNIFYPVGKLAKPLDFDSRIWRFEAFRGNIKYPPVAQLAVALRF